METPVIVSAAVEGLIDEAVVERLIRSAGGEPGHVFGKRGKPALRTGMNGFANAARRAPWIVLVDLDADRPCAPALREVWLPDEVNTLCFRIAVRAIEAWLLADHERLASYLSISAAKIPHDPESLEDPKRSLIELARKSRRRAIREDVVPRHGSGRSVGQAYTMRMIEYVVNEWRPEVAAERAASLHRTIQCLETLVRDARRSST